MKTAIKFYYLSKQQPLRFKMKHHAMPDVIDEFFQPQKFHGAQSSVVAPINVNL